jgi:hypothetical protein
MAHPAFHLKKTSARLRRTLIQSKNDTENVWITIEFKRAGECHCPGLAVRAGFRRKKTPSRGLQALTT